MEKLAKPKQEAYDKLGPKVAKALESRHFDAWYFATAEEAKQKVLSLIEKGKSIGWGGSYTLSETGILDAIKTSGDYKLIDRDAAKDKAERKQIQKQALIADYFIMSANAISEDGVIVNLDGNGNRAAAMVFGPDNVIVVAGMNKVCKTVEDAIRRTRTIAAPINAQRFDINTPCKQAGSCANCKSSDSICSSMVISRLSFPAGKIKVILIGQDLGF